MAARLKAPFPYFGGKSAVAPLVWKYLGDVDNYSPKSGESFMKCRTCYAEFLGCLRDTHSVETRSYRLFHCFGRVGSWSACSLGFALCAPGSALCSLANSLDALCLPFGAVLVDVIGLGYEFKVLNGVVKLVSVFVVNAHASGDRPVVLLPNMAAQQHPLVRFGHFDKRSFFATAFISSADSDSANRHKAIRD